MPRYLYVRAKVTPPCPHRSELFNTLLDKATDTPVPDVVPHADPGGISFSHCFVEAEDADDAYFQGGRSDQLPPRTPNTAMNDYVVLMDPA
jgi:hypothetical protein